MVAAAIEPGDTLTGLWLVILIIVLGVLGVLLLGAFAAAWRRFNRRQERPAPRTPMPDVWAESGQRLIAKIDREQERRRRKKPPDEPPRE